MKAFLLFIILAATSCCTTYTVTEFNTVGVITNFRPISSPDGDMMYTILISEEEKAYAQYITSNRFSIGDTVRINAKMTKLK
jgi:hypothetical protein